MLKGRATRAIGAYVGLGVVTALTAACSDPETGAMPEGTTTADADTTEDAGTTGGDDQATADGASTGDAGTPEDTTTGADESTGSESGGELSGDCVDLLTDPAVNWRESLLQTDQEIVECLSSSLGRPVGYGERALGGYDPEGGSTLTVITKDSDVSVEQQILDAVSGEEHNWIVFDKHDFGDPTAIAMYRLQCGDPEVQGALGGSTEAECADHTLWCANNGVAEDQCLEEFFNDRLNDDLPISNVRIGSNTTIDGRQSEAYFLFNGFKIGSDLDGEPVETANSVILTNLLFQGAGHTEDHQRDPDMIRSTGASHDIWIHQNTFDLTGDSAFDVKVGAYDITVSFNVIKDVKRAALHGSSDSRKINEQITTTIHHNVFFTSDGLYDEFGNTGRRVPLIRRGTSHMFDNLFYNYRKDVLSVRVGAEVAFEDNMFLANPAAAGDDDTEYFVENLLDDFREGGLEITGSRVWLSDASCVLDPATEGDLTASHGSTRDVMAEYEMASRDAIEQHRMPAGQGLADYVLATAGKGGAEPFTSPTAPSVEDVMAMPHRICD